MADHSNRSTDAAVVIPAVDQSKPLVGARSTLILLILINLFNYIDRQVLAAVEPDIRRDLLLSNDAHDPNAKAKMGLLSTAFLITYMTLSPVFGILAERFSADGGSLGLGSRCGRWPAGPAGWRIRCSACRRLRCC
jgi:MFS family permease